MTGAELEDDIPLGERKTVTDFCYLLDKSKQLFNGLRSVPLVPNLFICHAETFASPKNPQE